MEFPHLLSPIQVGPLKLKNRIGGSCTTTGGADINGYVQEECLYSYAARSEGGAGFITIECTFATDWGAKSTSFGNPRLSGRAYYDGQSNLAEAIKQCGAAAFIQITPGFGRQGSSKLSGETPPAPSAIPSERPQDFEKRIMPRGYETKSQTMGKTSVPRVLTIEEIDYMESTYGDAVAAARICGYDAVELHSPHGYLIHQFLSPRSNQRNDLYGGSLENRFRFLRNLLVAARRRVGPDFCIGVRLSGDEHMPGAIHEEELIQVAKWCEDLGASYIHLSDGSYEARAEFFPQDAECFIKHARNFKKELHVPLIVPGMHDPVQSEEVLEKGWADMISQGRQLVADQRWPRKVEEGDIYSIKRCLRCNVCLGRFNRGLSIRCAVNPNVGREKYHPMYNTDGGWNLLRPTPDAKMPPCENACPAHLDINAYVLMASRGQIAESYRRLKVELPFPAIIGRVCPHPCETPCNRGKFDDSININGIKRFVADWAIDQYNKGTLPSHIQKQALPEKVKVTKKEKVAVVGAGPAGLSAAYFLCRKGYDVTVLEAQAEAGGMMTYGVPEHRLPKKVVKWEIDAIKKMGVTIKTNSPVGKGANTLEALKRNYDAVFVAVGAQNGLKLGITGEDIAIQAVDLLKDVNSGKKVAMGKKVAVMGGGSVAMDAAMVAKRLGASDVTVYYRRTRDEMPATGSEVEEALKEGVKIEMLCCPAKLAKSGSSVKVTFNKMKLGKVDASGRKRPEVCAGADFEETFDNVIAAVGQCVDGSFLGDSKVKVAKNSTIVAEERSLATSVAGIYAGGDAQTGPATMIEAIAAGRTAATAIDCYLQGKQLPPPPPEPVIADPEEPAFKFHLRELTKEPRVNMEEVPAASRTGNKEICTGFANEAACVKEARRCLTCRCTSFRY